MQTNRKSFGTFKNDRYVQVAVMDEWPLWQVLLYVAYKLLSFEHISFSSFYCCHFKFCYCLMYY